MKGINSNFGMIIVFAFVAVFLFAGLMSPMQTADGDVLKKFSSETELVNFLEENAAASNYYGGGIFSSGMARDIAKAAVPTAMTVTDEGSGASAGSDDFSKTNIQVEGVDEADIVKTDGKYIYTITAGKVYITDAYPAENAEIVSEMTIDGNPTEMYINDEKLVIFTSVYGREKYYFSPMVKSVSTTSAEQVVDEPMLVEDSDVAVDTATTNEKIDIMPTPEYSGPVSMILVYDVSDAANPVLENNITIDGYYYDSRMIGDYVYAISQKDVYNFDNPGIPRIAFGGSAERTIMPDVYYFDVPGTSYQFTSIVSVNVKNIAEEPNSKVYLMSYGQNVYVSQNNIYITYRKQVSQKEIIENLITNAVIPNLPPELALKVSTVWDSDKQDYEKTNEITEIIDEHVQSLGPEQAAQFMKTMEEKIQEYYTEMSKELERTQIHKIGVSSGNIDYIAGGSVPGNILNQFSMDEYNGYFRIATSTSGWIGGMRGKTLNHMYVLDSGLNIVGSLENLAEGETIYSARFMGDKAYMVTFRRVDPLFVIDLSNPTNPVVLGKLKIPGYSDYLHPYDENHLIGIGMDADENGRTTALKVSLFDVTDVNNPVELSNYVFGGRGSYSYALHDHKAFMFNKEKELLVIPATTSDWTEDKEWREVTYSNGAQVFKINLEQGILFRGEITHQETEGTEDDETYFYPRYDSSVKRSLYINDVLYTISDNKIKMNMISDLSEVNEIKFGE